MGFRLLILILVPALGQEILPAAPNSVPMLLKEAEPLDPMFEKGGVIDVPCVFDGQNEECFLDTGSNSTRIKNDAFSKAYPSVDQNSQTGISSAAVRGEDILISKLQVGPLVLKDFRAFRPNVSSACAAGKNHSTLGVDAFKNQILNFAFGSENTLAIASDRPGASLPNSLFVSPAGQFSVPVVIAGETVGAMWDTGAALTVVSADFVSAHPDDFEFIKDWRYDDPCDGGQGKFYWAKSMTVGGFTFQHVLVSVFSPFSSGMKKFFKSFPGPEVQMSLGFNVITQKNWIFDLKNKTWSVQ